MKNSQSRVLVGASLATAVGVQFVVSIVTRRPCHLSGRLVYFETSLALPENCGIEIALCKKWKQNVINRPFTKKRIGFHSLVCCMVSMAFRNYNYVFKNALLTKIRNRLKNFIYLFEELFGILFERYSR